MRNKLLSVAIASTLVISSHASANMNLAPTELQGLNYKKSLVTGVLDANIPKPESILGFPVGQRAATPEQITEALKVWQKASDKIQLVEYARSHEGRPCLLYTSPSPRDRQKSRMPSSA